MAECDHCGMSFDDEAEYLRHLRDAHPGDLSRIEQRRVEELESESDSEGVPTVAVYGATVVGILLAGAIAYVFFLSGGGAGDESVKTEPTNLRSVHDHGTMNVTIDGQTLDFSQQQYQLQDDYFHYEGGSGERWHVHGQQVTLEYALSTLGIHVSENSVTFDGTTYDGDDEGTTVTFEVNGESVNPRNYVLEDGDHVRVIVTTA
jgi:hypothetical protein